jgi:hypothetical protein
MDTRRIGGGILAGTCTFAAALTPGILAQASEETVPWVVRVLCCAAGIGFALALWPKRGIGHDAGRDMRLREAITYAACGRTDLELFTDAGPSLGEAGKALKEFEQLAHDGRLRVWGKENAFAVHRLVEPAHWLTHYVDFLSLFRDEVRSEPRNRFGDGDPFFDLMVSRREVEQTWPWANHIWEFWRRRPVKLATPQRQASIVRA